MIHTDKEKLLNKYSLPVTINETEIILKQMKYSICKIENKNGNGTGFFCQIIDKKLLITNNHILDEEELKKNDKIRVTLNDNKIKITLKIKDYYTSIKYDTTIIEINNVDENIIFLEIDNDIFDENINLHKQSIYILQYPKYGNEQKSAVSYGLLNEIGNDLKVFDITHFCCTDHGSSGSPILKLSNKKIIGIHKESAINFEFNIGTLLKYPINEYLEKSTTRLCAKKLMTYRGKDIGSQPNNLNQADSYNTKGNMLQIKKPKEKKMQPNKPKENNQIISKENEIKLIVKIEQKDINQDIYFLDNCIQDNHFHDNLKELNELNTEIFIKDKKYKYAKYFNTQKVGLYEIKIKFNIKIKDCSYMFCGCSNIISIDLSCFDTKNVTNMSNMFDKCYNLTKIDLSSFNTENVSNMSYMFSVCTNLIKINVSSFNTKKVTNMGCMFNYCSNLKNVDLTSFDTTNVVNISNIFYGCPKLNQVKINNMSHNLIQELQNNNKNTIIVDQSGNNIPDINNNIQRSFSLNLNMNNFKINNIPNIYNSLINFKNN